MNPLWELVEAAAKSHSDQPSLHTLNRTYSFAEVKRIAENIATQLRECGLQQGDLVATILPNSLDWLFVLACAHEGLLSVSVYSTQHAEDLGAALVVHRDGVGHSSSINSLAVDEHWLRKIESEVNRMPARDYDSPETLARLVLTSGTTGKAKAAEYSVATFRARLDNAERLWNLGSGNRINFVGVSTMGGLSQGMLSLWARAPFFAFDSITDTVPALIKELDVTLLLGSTINLAHVADAVSAVTGPIDSVTQILIGGSTPNNALLTRLSEVFPSAVVLVLYGSTEGGVIAARRAVVDADARNVGTPFPGVHVEVFNDEGVVLGAEEVGEIRYRTPELIQRYYRDQAATTAALRDGFFYPGDRGRITAEGELFITGRVDDLINIGGVKIDPSAIEHVALSEEGIADAALFDRIAADGKHDLAMALVARTREAMHAVDAAIRATTPLTVPAVYIRVTELPRNNMGKLDRSGLARFVDEHTA